MSLTHKPGINGSTTGILFFLLIFMFHNPTLSAQDEIPDSLVKERIDHIQNMLDEGKPNAKLWWNA